MEKLIQTNKNGIDTLTLRVSELNAVLSALKVRVDGIDLEPLVENQVETARHARINGQRIATIRKAEYQEQINAISSELKELTLRVSGLETSISLLQETQNAQNTKIKALEDKISENTEVILEQAEEQVATEAVLDECIVKIDKALGNNSDVSINLSLLRNKVDENGKVIDGCIIGIDKNASDNKKIEKNVELTAQATLLNDSNIKNLVTVAAKVNEALDLVRTQVHTNSLNIRKK